MSAAETAYGWKIHFYQVIFKTKTSLLFATHLGSTLKRKMSPIAGAIVKSSHNPVD